jgi:hypothetical protein
MQPEHHDEYDDLPVGIKSSMTREEYMWLTEEQKSDLVRSFCEPDE